MADIATIKKKVSKPLRIMGDKSTTVEGQVLFFEYGTFAIADNATSGTLPTGLTNVVAAVFTPANAGGITAAIHSTLAVASGAITINSTDPGAGTGAFTYFLIGTIETA